ncbi:hypothetical protein [Hathewaya limosa]|uniref:Lipoprotein n=1 Tax=Hathewaya limosa TaxID=1536 RepID=A0ABU0JV94_HATLI|nr:hypothetical protein [Hathewaya limosa]MDQ0481024.1 hypothetical protein [Hathewaya limosa]
MTLNIPTEIFETMISAISIIMGSLIGAFFSWIISKKTTSKNIKEQYKILERNMIYEEKCKKKEICKQANIIRLDICTALFQSIRAIKEYNWNEQKNIYPIPINKNYSSSVATLSNYYSLQDISYIYQLYSIIEKMNSHIMYKSLFKEEYNGKEVFELYRQLIEKVYGANSNEILKLHIDNISYEDLYKNTYIKEGYKNVLEKLDKLCVK